MTGMSVDMHKALFTIEPWDEHNKRTVANVHPNDWVNPEPAERYNLVVLGAGTAGLISAIGSASFGARVALIEKALIGGDCLSGDCVPSKALIRSSCTAAEVRAAHIYGVNVPDGVAVDFQKIMAQMRRLRPRISNNDSAHRVQGAGVDVSIGAGTFTGPDRIEVSDKTLRFSKAVIATGARAATPPIPGLEEAGYLTNETVFSLTELPRRLIQVHAHRRRARPYRHPERPVRVPFHEEEGQRTHHPLPLVYLYRSRDRRRRHVREGRRGERYSGKDLRCRARRRRPSHSRREG